MRKKFLILFLIIVSVVCLAFGISACGGSSDDTSTDSGSVTSSSNSSSSSSSSKSSAGSSSSSSDSSSADSTSIGSSTEDSSAANSSSGNSSDGDSTGSASSEHEHSLQAVEAVAATCTTDGNTAYWYCKDCGKYYSDADATTEITLADTVIVATGHSYDTEKVTWTWSNDYSTATATFTCKNDSGHTEEVTATVTSKTTAATCTADGETVYTATATFDGSTFTDTSTEVIEATGHTYNSNGICTECGAEVASSEGLEYTLSDDETYYTVSGIGTCTDTDIYITGTYNSLSVTEIAASAFSGQTQITSVSIFGDITTIGSYAFFGCSSLEGAIIGDSVTSIGNNAFYNCTSLISITIPDGVTFIGGGAFYNCTALTEINFNATAMENLSSSNWVFYCAGQSGDGITVNIGANVTKIPAYLFYPYLSSDYAPNIASVVFEDNSVCESIGSYAFAYCSSLTSITIPDSVTSISGPAFRGCTSLTSVSLGNSVASIGSYAFAECTSLTSITIPDNVISISEYTFEYCYSLTSITIPDNVTSIGSSAFLYCYKLVEVYNLSSLTITEGSTGNGYVGYYAKNVYTSESGSSNLFTQDDYMFYNDDGTYYLMGYTGGDTALTLPALTVNGETKSYALYQYAFSYCTSLTSITIPDSVTTIGSYAFSYCTSLESVYYNGTVSEWASISFGSATANPLYYAGNLYLNEILLTDLKDTDITSISAYAFAGWNVTSITIPDSVETIGNSAFYYCASLTSVNIGNSVTSIGSAAFSSCTALAEIIFNATAMDDLSSNNYVFSYAGQSGDGITVTIGANVTKIPAYLFLPYSKDSSHGPNITSVVFEDGSVCTSIGADAFMNCTSLTSVYYSGTASEWASISFSGWDETPLYYAGDLYLNGTLATDITIEGITTINAYAFYGCTSLTSVTIGDSVTSIGSSAFGECTSLESVTIGSSVETIGGGAFNYCYKLVEVYNLSSLEITAGSTDNGYVGYYALYVYASADNESSLLTYGDYTFYCDDDGNYYLVNYNGSETELTLPTLTVSGVTTSYAIHKYAFYENTKITSITIPSSVTSIGSYAFRYCTSLASVTIGSGITSIDTYAFYYCTALTEINFNATAMNSLSSGSYSSGNYVFYCAGQSGDGITVTIGANVTSIPAYLFYSSSSSSYAPKITSVVFEEGSVCTSIGVYAFQNCTSLTRVYYSGTADEWSAITIGSYNTYLTKATRYYYSASEPDYTDGYDYWHYVDGEIVVWVQSTEE